MYKGGHVKNIEHILDCTSPNGFPRINRNNQKMYLRIYSPRAPLPNQTLDPSTVIIVGKRVKMIRRNLQRKTQHWSQITPYKCGTYQRALLPKFIDGRLRRLYDILSTFYFLLSTRLTYFDVVDTKLIVYGGFFRLQFHILYILGIKIGK